MIPGVTVELAGVGARAKGNADTMTTHRIPAPQAQAFVACRKITNDPQTGEIVIVGPVSGWRARLAGREPVPPWDWRKGKRRWPQG